jgi:hypothetical protein
MYKYLDIIALTVFIILVIVIAAIVHLYHYTTIDRKIIGGGSISHPHNIMDAIHSHLRELTRQGNNPGIIFENDEKHGGKPAAIQNIASTKHWTSCNTWDELIQNPELLQMYKHDREEFREYLRVDWSDVRAELLGTPENPGPVYSDREWAGCINIYNGKAKVDKIVSSPHKIGENVDLRLTVAMVPSDIVYELVSTPAMFMFHTHPATAEGDCMPSDVDFATSIHYSVNRWGAGHLVVSDMGITLYGPSDNFIKSVWKDVHPMYQKTYRIFDLITAMRGRRSWRNDAWWNLEEFEKLIAKHDMIYAVWGTDLYPHTYYTIKFQTPIHTEFGLLEDYISELKTFSTEYDKIVDEEKNSKKLRGSLV